MHLQTLLAYLHDFTHKDHDNPIITSIEMDSREVKEGSLFVCIEGYTVDGHNFVQQAEERGAVAILAEKEVTANIPVIVVTDTKRSMAILADAFYGQPTHGLHLIGVTGTNGKTSTTHIIDHIFRHAGKKTGMIGTMYMKIRDEIIEVKNTTPESLTLQKTFAKMVKLHVDTAVMEVSSHALDLGRVHGCDFDVAVFTNLSQDHLDYHSTMDEYQQAKGLLFSSLGNNFNHQRPKYAVLNIDDQASIQYKKSTAAFITTYGITNNADIMAKNIELTSSGTKFDLVTPTKTVTVEMKLIGLFSVYNVLAAVAASLVSNLPLEVVVESIQTLSGISGRFEVVDEGQNYTVIVDYAHTPDSLENVLQTAKQFCKGRTVVVVGCGGDRDRSKRPIMAKIAVEHADVSIFTSDNPRSEDPVQILKDMETGVQGKDYYSIVDREEAIKFAVNYASKDDIIIIAGKGHETYQIIGDKVLDFDDRVVASRAIKGRL
ncbi:UDP-N-acetylmuramoyl-L-alanyl-D-glutamate--2,6-diaminopimelate ligase [Bacillus timonensis]|nr:UDP-N-acetylmuramoyl-L-alanyl-D-glutamate--2,6-diaminopimelate ligase [Bacillus timonensis]